MGKQSYYPIIYVVDENVEDSLILFYDLEEHGMEKGLYTFRSVQELIINFYKFDPSNPPRIILVDGFLKNESIVKALSTIKSITEFGDVPIVVMIGANYEKVYLKSFNLDVSGFVVKPVNIQLIKRYLNIGDYRYNLRYRYLSRCSSTKEG